LQLEVPAVWHRWFSSTRRQDQKVAAKGHGEARERHKASFSFGVSAGRG
jgi:hypothetical protein